MKKEHKKYLLVSFVVLALLFTSPYMFGAMDDLDLSVNVNSIADVYLTDGFNELTPYAELDADIGISLRAYVVFDDVDIDVTGFLALMKGPEGTVETETMIYDSRYGWWVGHFNLDNCIQGETFREYYVSFSANLPDYDYSQGGLVDYGLYGNTYSVRVFSSSAATPNPVEITEVPADTTIDIGETESIRWKYLYSGTAQLQALQNGELLKDSVTNGVTVPQVFTLSYTGSHAGIYEITFRVEPTDGSGNVAVEDSILVTVSVGGNGTVYDNPPSCDVLYYGLSGTIYPMGIQWDWNWYHQGAPSFGVQDYALAGVLTLTVNDQPDGALTSVWVVIDGERTFQFDNDQTGWTEAIWVYQLDTADMTTGLHTINVYGRDSSDAQEYLLYTITIGVRTLGLGGILVIAMFVISIPVTLIVMRRVNNFWLNKRKRLF